MKLTVQKLNIIRYLQKIVITFFNTVSRWCTGLSRSGVGDVPEII